MALRPTYSTNLGLLTGEASRQTVSVWDAICEGPIEGLVDGNASVYLDNDPIVDKNDETTTTKTNQVYSNSGKITLTNGSDQGVLVNDPGVDQAYRKGGLIMINNAATFTGCAGSKGSTTLTRTGGPVFTQALADMLYLYGRGAARITISGVGSTGGGRTYTITEFVDSSTIKVNFSHAVDFSGKDAILSFMLYIEDTSGTDTLDFSTNWGYTTGDYNFIWQSLSMADPAVLAQLNGYGSTKKYQRSTVQFRTGNPDQEPIKEIGSLHGNSISRTTSLNRVLDLHTDYYQYYPDDSRSNSVSEHTNTQGTDSTYIIDSVSDLGLTNSQEVDEIILTFEYQALYTQHYESGSQKIDGYAAYEVTFSFSRDGGSTYTDVTLPYIEHRGKAVQAFVKDENINLESFQPFDRWKIKVKRVTAPGGAYYPPDRWFNNIAGKYSSSVRTDTSQPEFESLWGRRVYATSQISTITSIIKYKLNYPYTAYAAITFDSKAFQNMPVRSYHIRGKKVKVPSNYVTREEASNGIAAYTRDSSGVIKSSYQDWDGTFRDEIYTNNPAWILYDLLLSKRYGLGRFVTDIDKWSFYRAARYCDELVPNGTGGEEPRYTCNIVLQKEEGARKVIKDIATNFLGLLHWLDGEMYLTMDRPSAPVYNFGRGNVIEGSFVYSTTEYKQRPNQYVVIYNNPELDYQQDFVLVEDTANVLERGVLLSKDTYALGCTSRSQAERFGRWKLFTSRLQTESVTFNTSINASFLNPGDIIEVQDAARDKIELSGRIASSGTVSTTVVPLDRTVTLQSGYSYTLNVMFFSPAAILVDDSATINSVSYVKGDVILTDNSGSSLTETSVNNLTDESDSNRPVNVEWKPNNHVESKTVSTSAGDVSSLTVSSAFSAAPNRDTMWSLTSRLNNTVQAASSKRYLVYSVAEGENLEWTVKGIEHFNSKFSSVENNFNLTVQDPDFKGPSSTDVIPSISNLTLALSND